jgi:hypothetical protein
MRLNQCDCCGHKFGLVSHSLWNRRFCSKLCRRVYRTDKSRLPLWAALLTVKADRGLAWAMSTTSMESHGHWASQPENSGS